ncbi:ribosomal-protein-alanine N-acetyltransferase [Paenibacillus shirakamiensis]|uniref:Ribosomal-protein-alanine N-acetyltransferase n=1 Tax=Paenibacillus shirakamiensis TaxID=1265935 RepID=A0ABS4JJ01_9BACL|nr:GNAT family N-acetyltransferase [Paenibacillus shirakamiensis]MBP2001683.1 ribosomal-protein-alanine N-acetyltransferase [Paenibacillus shirakamiensis]
MFRCQGEIPDLESARLILRKMGQEDAHTLFAYWSDPEVIRYMNIPQFTSIRETWDMLDLLNGLAETEDTMRWGIELKQTKTIIGTCGFNTWQLLGAYRGEIGYDLGRPYWRQGYMHEALSLILNYGFDVMSLNRIEALVIPGNTSSLRSLRRLGFREEGLLREYQQNELSDGFIDLIMLSLLKKNYV